MEDMGSNVINNNNSSSRVGVGVGVGVGGGPMMLEKKAGVTRPQEQLNCPRCNSTNTKFCYYNNYSLTQPRYFCKTCRRYWTEGGSLRNVPVGGGSRKNKRLPINSSAAATTTVTTSTLQSSNVSSTTAAAASTSFRIPDLNPPTLISHQFNSSHKNPIHSNSHIVDDGSSKELNMGFPVIQESANTAMELLRSGVASRGMINSFMPTLMPADSNQLLFSSGLPHVMQEFKPTLSFSIHDQYHHHGIQHESNGSAKILFPFGEPKHEFPRTTNTTTTDDHNDHEVVDHNRDQNKRAQDGTNINAASTGSYNWSGMLDHGGSW